MGIPTDVVEWTTVAGIRSWPSSVWRFSKTLQPRLGIRAERKSRPSVEIVRVVTYTGSKEPLGSRNSSVPRAAQVRRQVARRLSGDGLCPLANSICRKRHVIRCLIGCSFIIVQFFCCAGRPARDCGRKTPLAFAFHAAIIKTGNHTSEVARTGCVYPVTSPAIDTLIATFSQ